MADLWTVFAGIFGFLAAFAALIIIGWRFYIRKWSHFHIAKGCLPILGHIHLMKIKDREGMVDWFYNFSKKEGPTYVFFFFWRPVIFTSNLATTKMVLSNPKYITKTKQMDAYREWLGLGLLTGSGELWKSRRRLLTPAFHMQTLSNNIPVLERQAKGLVKHIKECSDESSIVKFTPMCNLLALGAISEFAMGVPMMLCSKNPEPSAKRFSEANKTLLKCLNSRFFNPLYKWDSIYRLSKGGKEYFSNLAFIKSFVKSVIEERIQIHSQSTISDEAKIFIDILLDAYQKKQIDIEGVMGEVSSFMFAGHETISTSLAWTVFQIAKHPDVQEKLHGDFLSYKERNLSVSEMLKEAVYLDCVIKEVLRLNAGPVFARVIEEDSQINDMKVPAGSELLIQGLLIHYNEEYWPNPLEFRPERFLEESADEYNFKFLPFSAGPRNCIGKRYALYELKVVVYYLLTSFKIEIAKEIENPYKFKVYVHEDTEFKFIPREN